MERVTPWVDYNTLFLTLQGWPPLNCYQDIFHIPVGNEGFTTPLINQSYTQADIWKVTFLCSHPYFYLQNSNTDFNFDSLRIIQLGTVRVAASETMH